MTQLNKFLSKRICLFIFFGLLISGNSYAATCTPNTSVTLSCDTLSLTGAGDIVISNGATVSDSGGNPALLIDINPTGSVTNNGTITASQGRSAFYNNNVLTSMANNGVISATGLSGTSNPAFKNSGTITNLTNNGSIQSVSTPGIFNNDPFSLITTFNNAQGGNSSTAAKTALTYSGKLPTNYNIIINSPSNFGQLIVSSGSGNTVFGISSLSAGASAVSSTPYASVLSGVTNTQLGIAGISKTGTSNSYGYTLSETGVGTNIWNLLVTSFYMAPSATDTQQSLVNTSQALQGTYILQNAVLANSFSYDCNVFGENGVCVSAGGRNTAVSAANGLNNTSALLIAAYRIIPSVRVGAYADQNLSVHNTGSTVNLGNNTPLIGLFGAWNERLDGTGTEVKVSAAYGQKNTTVTRQVVGTSEAGSGSSQLNSQGAQVTAKHGFELVENIIVSPYVGMRYAQNNMGGYTEGASSTVTAPLTYSALNTNATTALAGVGASYKFIPQATVFASAGVESDTNTANGTYSATGVAGLTPINFNANPVKTRPTATVGAYYDVEKNQRLGVTGIYRQEAYQATASTTVMATYTVGL